MKVLITGGNTRVMLDKVRFISNIFNGRTACEITSLFARAAATVTLIGNPDMHRKFGHQVVDVPYVGIVYETYDELYDRMKKAITENNYDIIIHSAAVSDYKIEDVMEVSDVNMSGIVLSSIGESGKISSSHDELYLKMVPTEKIIDKIREWGFKGKLVKFKLQVDMFDDKLLQIAKKSRAKSDADFIVANCLEWAPERAYVIDRDDNEVMVDRDDLPDFLFDRLSK